MALTVYTSKDNQWREYVNPLRGLTLERIVSLIEQGERGAFADLQWFYQAMARSRHRSLSRRKGLPPWGPRRR